MIWISKCWKLENARDFGLFQHFELQIKISRNKNAIRQNGFSYLVRNFVGFLGVQFVFFCGQIFWTKIRNFCHRPPHFQCISLVFYGKWVCFINRKFCQLFVLMIGQVIYGCKADKICYKIGLKEKMLTLIYFWFFTRNKSGVMTLEHKNSRKNQSAYIEKFFQQCRVSIFLQISHIITCVLCL